MHRLSTFLCIFFLLFAGSAALQAQTITELTAKAEKGDANAQLCLAFMYHKGEGVKKDYSTALKWYQKSAEQENIHAQYALANMYYNGEGSIKNYSIALKWFQRAANQGFANAQLLLAWMYYNGEGVPRDLPAAFKWFQNASYQNVAEAQIALAHMYYLGEGTPQNEMEGLAWDYAAKSIHAKDLELSGRIEGRISFFENKLDAKTVSQAQQRAKELQKKINAQQSKPLQ